MAATVDESAPHALAGGLHVADGEASLRFYRDLIGCDVFGHLRLAAGELWALRFGDSMLKLLAWDEPEDGGAPGPGRQLGIRYLTFHVTNPDEVVTAAHEHGFAVYREAYDFSPSVRNAILLDPDGNLVELCHGTAWEPV